MTFEGHVSDLFTVVTLCAQMTRDLLAMAKFVVFLYRPIFKFHQTWHATI